MIRALAVLLGALWLAGCDAAEPAREWPAPSPALWEVTAPDGGQGWLFGTVHALPDGVDWRTPAFDDAFARAGVLVVEIAELGDAGLATEAFESRAHSSGLPRFLDRHGDSFAAAAAPLMEQLGLGPGDLDDYEDWAAALVLANAIRSGDAENGVDRALLAEDKQVVGLETYDSQLAIFDGLDERQQHAFLDAVVLVETRRDPEAGLTAWLTGDVDTLEGMDGTGILADPDLRRILLVERNAAWLPRIADLVETGRQPFVGVGAAHILGPDGIAAGLEARGYAVRRIQ